MSEAALINLYLVVVVGYFCMDLLQGLIVRHQKLERLRHRGHGRRRLADRLAQLLERWPVQRRIRFLRKFTMLSAQVCGSGKLIIPAKGPM